MFVKTSDAAHRYARWGFTDAACLSNEGASSYEEGSSPSKDDVLPSAEGVLTSKDDVLPSAEGGLASKDDVLPSAEGVLASKDDVSPSAEGVLTSKDDVLRITEGACHLMVTTTASAEGIGPVAEGAPPFATASHVEEECAV